MKSSHFYSFILYYQLFHFFTEVFPYSILSTLLTSRVTSIPSNFHNLIQISYNIQRNVIVHSNLPHDPLFTNPGLIFPSQSVHVELSPPQTPQKSVLLPLFLTPSQPLGSRFANFKH